LLSDYWEQREKKELSFDDADLNSALQKFFKDSIEFSLEDYGSLLEPLLKSYKAQGIAYPMGELGGVDIAAVVVLSTKIQAIKAKLDASKAELLHCFEIEQLLTRLLQSFVFLKDYEMLSIKQVSYDESRIAPPMYIHKYIELGIDQKFNENTEKATLADFTVVTNTVLLSPKDRPYNESINLAPFVIDFNTLSLESGVKICFYASRHITDNSLNYRFLEDNAVQNLAKEEEAKAFELGGDISWLKEQEAYKKVRLDMVSRQFEVAEERLLATAKTTGSEDAAPDFSSLFG
jgi:hypothetical protein